MYRAYDAASELAADIQERAYFASCGPEPCEMEAEFLPSWSGEYATPSDDPYERGMERYHSIHE